MNEDEARTKWCPFVRHGIFSIHGASPAVNVQSDDRGFERNPKQARCIASGCMAWRTTHLDSDNGFCGLAGSSA